MEDWKFNLLLKIKRDDPEAFAGLGFSNNMIRCFQKMADQNFKIVGGQLCQIVKSKKKVTIWLKEPADIPQNPKHNVDYRVEEVAEIKWVPVARQSNTADLFHEAHEERGHPGRDPTLAFIKANYHWHGMKRDVEQYIRSCDICQRTHVDETRPPLEHIIEDEPFARWQIDLTTIPGVAGYFLIIIDCFTKFVWFKFLPTKHAAGVLSFILALIKKEGRKPRKIHSDNGGEFIADILKQVCNQFDIELIHGRPYHPQSQGQVERVNRTLKAMLYKLLESRYGGKEGVSIEDLESCFDEVVDLYNNNKHSSTGFTPMQLLRPVIKTPTKEVSLPELQQIHRMEMVALFAVARDNLVKAAEKQDKVHNAKHHTKLRVFKLGDKVLYRWPEELRKNGDFLYNSIARIAAVHKNGRYGLEWLENEPSNSKNRKTWSAGELKIYRERGPNNNAEPDAEVRSTPAASMVLENEDNNSIDGQDKLGEKQMGDREAEESLPVNTCFDDGGSNTNVQTVVREELRVVYESLVDAHEADGPNEEQWLQLTAVTATPTAPEPCKQLQSNAAEEERCQPGSKKNQKAKRPAEKPDYEIYRPRKRQRVKHKEGGSVSRQFRSIGLPDGTQ